MLLKVSYTIHCFLSLVGVGRGYYTALNFYIYVYIYTSGDKTARQISVSNEVYAMLSKVKGGRSFSETIKNCLDRKVQAREIMKFAGILKDKHKELDELNRKIADDRRRNPGRKFDW